MYKSSCNRCVKNWLKFPNRLGKNFRKPQGGIFFDSHCIFQYIQCNEMSWLSTFLLPKLWENFVCIIRNFVYFYWCQVRAVMLRRRWLRQWKMKSVASPSFVFPLNCTPVSALSTLAAKQRCVMFLPVSWHTLLFYGLINFLVTALINKVHIVLDSSYLTLLTSNWRSFLVKCWCRCRQWWFLVRFGSATIY